MIRLSIIILTLNQDQKLKNCLGSVVKDIGHRQDFEVIVIDNNTQKDISQVIRGYLSRIIYIKNPENKGVAPARNQGIRIARGDYLMFIDDDAEVVDGCFQKIIDFMDKTPDCWCLGTKQIKPDGSLEYNARTFYTLPVILARRTFLGIFMKKWTKMHLMHDWDHKTTRKVDWVAGASFVMRREAVNMIGSLDESYFFGFEDVDWCHRVKLAGKSVYYLHDATVIHHVQGSSRKLFSRQALNHFLSAIRYFCKFNMY